VRAPEAAVPPEPSAQQLAAAARDAARADFCRYLAACYYQPDPAFGEEGLFASMAAAAATLDERLLGFARQLGETYAALPLQELLIDYTRLFLGPVQAPARPYASVWLHHGADQLMTEATEAVRGFYAEGGFELAEDFQDLPDHVAAELEFLYLLIHRGNVARWSGDASALQQMQALQQRFLDQHLGRWLGPFLLAQHEAAQTPFYEALAEATEAFVRLEGQRGGGGAEAGAAG
jgi:TorA maturation chaperone TorD